MQQAVSGVLRPLQGPLKVILVVLALLALLATTSIAAARPARAATTGATLKMVLIVGPSSDSDNNKTRSDVVAQHATSWGMAVTKLYTPHATWNAVVNAVNGANFVVYMGHGNGWPSPYGPYQEDTKDGLGLNYSDGSSTLKYYGAKWIRNYWHLAPNAIVALNHLCYSAGNGEPGMAIPTWDVARQRVDNYANGFLYAGAKAVFAYGVGYVENIVDMLFTTSKTMDGIFTTVGAYPGLANYGFVGWNDRYFASQRMPGFTNHLDPESDQGFRRALTGDMNMTSADWMSGAGGSGGGSLPKPTVSAPRASFVAGTSGQTKVTVRLSWDASPSPDVVAYDLQYSQDSGTWTGVSLASRAALTADAVLASGSYYRFRLRATDVAGTVGDWVTSASRRLGKAQETATSLTYSGTWSSQLYLAGASKSYIKKTAVGGNSVRYAFSGSNVGVVTTLGPARGMAELWLDGTKVASLDLYAATQQTARVVWASGVTSGSHVLEVRVTGTRNALATAARVDVDAFVVWK